MNDFKVGKNYTYFVPMKMILLLLCLSFNFFLFAQNKELNKTDFDSLRQASRDFRFDGMFDSLLLLEYRINELAKRERNIHNKIKSDVILANIYTNIGEFDRAFASLQTAESVMQKHNTKDHLVGLYTEYAKLYLGMEIYDQSLKYANLAEVYFNEHQINDNGMAAYFYALKGIALENLNKYQKALECKWKSSQMVESPTNYSSIAKYYLYTDQHKDSAFYYAQKAYDLGRSKKFSLFNSNAGYAAMGMYHEVFGNPDSAILLLDKSISCYEKLNNNKYIYKLYKSKARVYQKLGDSLKQAEQIRLAFHHLEKDTEYVGNIRKKTLSKIIKNYDVSLNTTDKKHRLFKYTAIVILCILAVTLIFLLVINKKKAQLIVNTYEEKTHLESKVYSEFEELDRLSFGDGNLFLVKFKKLYGNFFDQLLEKHPELTGKDFELIAYLCMQQDAKQIAQNLSVQHRTIQTRKYRLRKKLDVDSQVKLIDYFKSIGFKS